MQNNVGFRYASAWERPEFPALLSCFSHEDTFTKGQVEYHLRMKYLGLQLANTNFVYDFIVFLSC